MRPVARRNVERRKITQAGKQPNSPGPYNEQRPDIYPKLDA
jgi:hypothetical protein